MTIEELEKKLTELDDLRTELNTQIAELKAQREEPKSPHRRWRPIFNENYYFIQEAEVREFIWNEDRHDNAFYSVGNVFMTKEAANFAVERLKALAEMREWAGSWDDPYAIAYVKYNYQDARLIVVDNTGYSSFGEMRFATSEDAKNCINKVGEDRIKKYYFMIPEEKQ